MPTKSVVVVRDMKAVNMVVTISKVLKWRLMLFTILLKLAVWVGSFGEIEIVNLDQSDNSK